MDTKTDRELIELAAKSYGLSGSNDKDIARYISKWNPLIDDGDALRLAVHLELFGTPDFDSIYFMLQMTNGYDKYTLMRRAIVMAAAKIGEGVE